MFFREYKPEGGWIKYRKRKALMDNIIAVGVFIGILVIYGLAEYLESGM